VGEEGVSPEPSESQTKPLKGIELRMLLGSDVYLLWKKKEGHGRRSEAPRLKPHTHAPGVFSECGKHRGLCFEGRK
jgi:hypothetical protein